MTEFILQSIVLPYLVATLVGKILLRKERQKPKKQEEPENAIKGLVSTEKQGNWITVCFQMTDGSLRNFKVKWLEYGHGINGAPNQVVDMESFDSVYEAPFYEAARHAAEIHMGTTGSPEKSVYENPEKWLN